MPKKRRTAATGPTGPARKKLRRTKPESSDSDEPIPLHEIPSHPPSPDLPRTTRSTAPPPAPAPAPAPVPATASAPSADPPATRQPNIPPVSTGSVGAIFTPCLQCVKKWTKDNSTMCPHPRDTPISECHSCRRASPECSLLPNHFYGPLAAAQKATGHAQQKACISLKNALEAHERKNEEETGSPPKENTPKENAGPGSLAQERLERGELLKAIRSLDRNVFRLMNTIREVRGLELISDEA